MTANFWVVSSAPSNVEYFEVNSKNNPPTTLELKAPEITVIDENLNISHALKLEFQTEKDTIYELQCSTDGTNWFILEKIEGNGQVLIGEYDPHPTETIFFKITNGENYSPEPIQN